MHEFVYDGTPSSSFGIYVFDSDSLHKSASKDYEVVSVLGRSGDLIFDNKRYLNVEVEYPFVTGEKGREKMTALMSFLASKKGYHRLEDSMHPDEFYLAYCREALEPHLLDGMARGYVRFTRKPQRYLKSGEIEVTAGSTIYNPTEFDAKPYLHIVGTGTLTVNGVRITVTGSQQYTDIDCEAEDCFMGSLNLNDKVAIEGYEFPVLSAGENALSIPSGMTVTIKPRWYRI